jgi:hypothetical protein
LLLLTVLALFFKMVPVALVLLSFCLVPLVLALPTFRKTVGLRKMPLYFFMTYIIYFSCAVGSLFGGLKNRMFYFYSGV